MAVWPLQSRRECQCGILLKPRPFCHVRLSLQKDKRTTNMSTTNRQKGLVSRSEFQREKERERERERGREIERERERETDRQTDRQTEREREREREYSVHCTYLSFFSLSGNFDLGFCFIFQPSFHLAFLADNKLEVNTRQWNLQAETVFCFFDVVAVFVVAIKLIVCRRAISAESARVSYSPQKTSVSGTRTIHGHRSSSQGV